MRNEKGFTLIELMIVVAIIGIIASLAITSYNASGRKVRRADAKASLLELSGQFERCFTSNGQYTTTVAPNPVRTCAIVDNAGALTAGNTLSKKGNYALAIAVAPVTLTANTFAITATPVAGAPADPECTSFTINHIGQRTATGGVGNTGPGCW